MPTVVNRFTDQMKMSFLNRQKLPLVIEPVEESASGFASLIDLCGAEKEFFREKLLLYGALLFRGFDVKNESDFEAFVRSFSRTNLLDYAGGVSPRLKLRDGGVYTSTEYPPHLSLALHNELSYSDKYPARLYFCCQVAPAEGGETPIADSRRILKKMDAGIVRRFRAKKVRYERNLSGDAGSGYAWQDAFETDDKRVVEAFCRESGVDFEWKANGGLRLSQTRPATAVHPATGEEVWFNQADGLHPSNLDEETYDYFVAELNGEFRLNAHFGDGSPLDADELERIRRVLREERVIFPWQAGDVLILDNLLTAHGRMPFTGARKILVAMT